MDRRSKGYLMVAAAIALVAVGVAVWAVSYTHLTLPTNSRV